MSTIKKSKIFCYFKQPKFTACRVALLFLLRKWQTFSYQLKEFRHMCSNQRNVDLKIVLKYNYFILDTALYRKHIFKKKPFQKSAFVWFSHRNYFVFLCRAFWSGIYFILFIYNTHSPWYLNLFFSSLPLEKLNW